MNTNDIPLGKEVTYTSSYDSSLLYPVERYPARKLIGIGDTLPFSGRDVWTAYEISWLDLKGKPLAAIGELIFPADSEFIVESKSLKLYLNSFNQTKIESAEKAQQMMISDLSRVTGKDVTVRLFLPQSAPFFNLEQPEGSCIDDIDVDIRHYRVQPDLLETGNGYIEESVHSHLLRTNCPVTGQPDWATVVITYSGKPMVKAGLLRYLISYREHTGFHENCVESIFVDIMNRCSPETLTVYARFTRRGGIDINPYRSTGETLPPSQRLVRQ